MEPRRRRPTPERTPIEFPELDDDEPTEVIRQASLLLNVPEWIDPETGELADDELTRLEEH